MLDPIYFWQPSCTIGRYMYTYGIYNSIHYDVTIFLNHLPSAHIPSYSTNGQGTVDWYYKSWFPIM